MSTIPETKIPDSEKRERLRNLIADFDTAMLVTRTPDGNLRSRPLAIADVRDDGALYFSTAADSGKVHELEGDPHVNIALQNGRKFVSMSGVAHVVDDRALSDRLWSESWKVWFPKGREDPSLRILVVEPTEAAYWDISGIRGLRYLFDAAKAYIGGKRSPSDDDERHTARVKL